MEQINKDGMVNIIPNARGTFIGLRNMGYENVAAVADLIDNSIDAKATEVRLYIDDINMITIADNGTGMSRETLYRAIQVGGKKVHDEASDLGKYGYGLIAASLSLGRRIRIITKFGSEYNTGILDCDIIEETDQFLAEIRKSSQSEISSFNLRTNNATSGTVVIIDKCDNIKYKTAEDLSSKINESIAQTFRYFIREGVKFYNNDKRINYYDPLFLDTPGTIRRVDKDVEIATQNGLKKMHVLAVTVADHGGAMNKRLHINIPNQGFYIMRNNREIASALEFEKVFKKHNDFNLLRIELSFDRSLDDMMGINIKKQDITPNITIINDLNDLLQDTIAIVRKEAKVKQKLGREKPNPFKQSIVEKTPEPHAETSFATLTAGSPSLFGSYTASNVEEDKIECNINTRFKSESDPLLEVSISNKIANIWYNGKNSYYETKIINGENGVDLKRELDVIIRSVVETSLRKNVSNSIITELVNNMAKSLEKGDKDGQE